MSTWKKIVVSGSDISQLNNDRGYLTNATLPGLDAWTTASVNGVQITSGQANAIISFVTASGQGITIVGVDGAPDTLTFGLSNIPNSSLTNSSITIAGTSVSLGGTITLTTILNGSGTVSGSSLSSAAQGEVVLTTNGVAGTTVDLGLQTTDNPTFAGATLDAIRVGITAANEIDTTSGNLIIDSAGGTVTVDDNLVISGDLVVNGTTISANTANLDIEDRYILLNSGSNVIGDSGIVFGGSTGVAQQGSALIWDASFNADDGRLAVVNTLTANATGDQTPSYHVVGTFSGSEAAAATAQADHLGNIRTEGGDIWIYG